MSTETTTMGAGRKNRPDARQAHQINLALEEMWDKEVVKHGLTIERTATLISERLGFDVAPSRIRLSTIALGKVWPRAARGKSTGRPKGSRVRKVESEVLLLQSDSVEAFRRMTAIEARLQRLEKAAGISEPITLQPQPQPQMVPPFPMRGPTTEG